MKIFFILALPFALFATFFEDRIPYAKEGDFVVYENNKNSSMLIINQIDDKKIIIEEVSFPSYLKNKIVDPQKWLEQKAPGNTSWRIYELDRKTQNLTQAYSYTENSHLLLNEQNFFLSKFFSLNLLPVTESYRRKIGSPTIKPDTRPYWNPPIYIDGIKHQKPSVAFYANWPNDGSKLENERINLYFIENSFFPSWIEIEASKIVSPFKVSNSGNRDFNKKTLPQRRPFFTKKPYLAKDKLIIELIAPKALQSFDLAVADLTNVKSHILNISYKTEITGEKVKIFLDTKNIQKNTPHRLVLFPKNAPDISCETTFSF